MGRATINLSLLLVACALVGFVRMVFHDPKAEVDAIQKCFEKIPNTRLTYISDLTKQASQSVTAYLDVEGKGEIGFTGLSPSSFRRCSHIRLHGIGPFGFRTYEVLDGEEAYGSAIDIGPRSPIPAVRKLGINSVQSALTHYDELLAVVSHWPTTTNQWPSSWDSSGAVHFASSPKTDYYFCLKRPGTELP